MSTNRRTKRRGAKPGITPEAIAAWQAADFRALHRALGLAPWEPSPLPREIIALGCSQDDEVDADSGRCWDQALPKALAIQRKLLKVTVERAKVDRVCGCGKPGSGPIGTNSLP
jgi:hypothetical protein